jgi:hypothetical protein
VLWVFSNNHNALWHLKVCESRVVAVKEDVKVKDRKRLMSGKKKTTMRCGIRETATMRNSMFRLHENTAGCGGRFHFYSHDAM